MCVEHFYAKFSHTTKLLVVSMCCEYTFSIDCMPTVAFSINSSSGNV